MKFTSFISLIFSVTLTAQASLAQALTWQDEIIQEINLVYKPWAEEKGYTFLIEKNLKDLGVVGSAERKGNDLKVVLSAGLINSDRLTADGLRFTICHEIGHLLGGAPRKNIPMESDFPMDQNGFSFISSEGQADYYANLVCFRKIVGKQNHLQQLKKIKRASFLITMCDAVWGKDSDDSLICQRASLGGLNMLVLNHDFPIFFDKPDFTQAEQLVRDAYPSRQCRLDTVFKAALCKSSMDLEMNPLDMTKNECSSSVGERPACWYTQE